MSKMTREEAIKFAKLQKIRSRKESRMSKFLDTVIEVFSVDPNATCQCEQLSGNTEERMRVRLIDIALLVPLTVKFGIIKCKNGNELQFDEVNDLDKQYQLDYVSTFDIRTCLGDRVLYVWLENN